jgi:hypothetical protein
MTIEMTSRYRCHDRVHARKFGDETVVLDLGKGEYFSLDAVGSAIWEGLADGLTLNQLVERLTGTYDAAPEAIRRDVERIAGELVAAGLIVPLAVP